MGLERYREKRDFGITPEPRGRVERQKGRALSFVIQKHAASRLHYDFRLELDGVLLSWAVPKGPSLDPRDKRLAVHVEDHPLEYGGFEGIIPPRQYGAGTVMLWDRGTWTPVGDARAGYAKGHLKFHLDGEKLHGGWTLIRTQGSKYGGKGDNAWLLIKENDEFAQTESIVEAAPDSVLSGRNLDEIAEDRDHEWHSNRTVKENVGAGALGAASNTVAKRAAAKAKSSRQGRAPEASTQADVRRERKTAARKKTNGSATLSATAGAKKAAMPRVLTPTLATLVSEVPEGDEWLHEIKFDGYRMLCRIDGGDVRFFSRNGKDWTAALQPLVSRLPRLSAGQAWIDGELAVLDTSGHTSFQALQNALADSARHALVFFVFDLLYLDGYDLRPVALVERKRLLQSLVGDGDAVMRYSVAVQGAGPEFFKQACRLGLEGAISKRAASTYSEGQRTKDWLKVKCLQRQEMVIGGFTDPQGSRSGFGALLLGVNEPEGLRYSGKVGTGFDDETLAEMRPMLAKLEQAKTPFINPPRGYEAKGAHWVKPQLVAEIAFTEWSNDGALRHPSFQGLRVDKNAADVVRERPAPLAEETAAETGTRSTIASRRAAKRPSKTPTTKATSSPRAATKQSRAKPDGENIVAKVKLSNPDKLYFPEAKLTKRDLAHYYVAVWERMLPHVRGRPLSLVRCPDGWKGQCFYQKHADKSVHEAVARVEVTESSGRATYFAANSLTALVGLVQWGVIELHPWGSRVPRLDHPDRLIFDFDPGDDVKWKPIVEALSLFRTLLDDLQLKGFLKTTGGKGLHVVVPIKATLDWGKAKAFTQTIAELLARTFPDRFTATVSKSHRAGKIYIDYLRNGQGATAIAPYGIRARKNAPVSTPIAWEELEDDVRFDHFNVTNIPARLDRLKVDPWAGFDKTKQAVTRAMWERVGYATD